ncbi:MAG: DNA repair protein RadA [Candidatus Blackburnbacteria bacterium RIFCSPHIGHO2_01_FULL_44_64]|uniref:DNA repair protein RadA n=1 Tax=Candidatus Blackburnbacteria bacterium RIFCSPHIGHO2_02_FULL_44_20 TaxID=1797516 RepID=A0A1G1V6B5_9BACT|nr:MAG: DNA repair protein RadA [Candidatus Blackburnbacteria bacterium RIFCSPHIGHO2_01_FULL_44_64]OGY10958.1 MAG: DNA repair protein RadA [Candidatus Blackburnbacteria bacterium RIFCSPHIGHO2_02_FULL_44_20]OGY11006.1 MAG: DNA repair protein RadA [Candidatus Blackburnbacteria bacterium RIFCSPHIGHO2_12_FULL_44_25]OGY13653.1 MAG: DNA repair protein RadA [Candidatus Blackburnbacteria bacterium RIFCSPLOWO2_01_FULL_44_43]OGY15507.1 MAG: DNA repair protein RadA [Candidatus Blackburnbacteria bacterium 
MPRSTSQYVCQQCGFSTPKWVGKCPNCGIWNSMVETPLRSKSYAGQAGRRKGLVKAELVGLTSIKKEDHGRRTTTKIAELDRVLGGGIVPGMSILLAGEPGIGKSTLLLQLADNIAGTVVYVSGEESATQIAGRAARLGVKNAKILVLEETDADSVIASIPKDAELVIVDSVQTLTTRDLTGTAGSVGQVRECANRLTSFAKANSVPMFIVGHVTKEGTIAGPRVLEHMVDTVLWFEGERRELLRVVRAIKNRFGPTDEVGIFSMGERGLEEVSNPSQLFIGQAGKVSGSVITVVLEGTRPMLVEIQALVSPTKLSLPRRSGTGVDARRLELIIAVLGRRVGIPLWDYDVFVNVAGGITVSEPAADLAIALAIASAFHDKPVGTGIVAIGEVGLLGEIRESSQLERRLKEARRLGFTSSLTSKQELTLSALVRKAFVS